MGWSAAAAITLASVLAVAGCAATSLTPSPAEPGLGPTSAPTPIPPTGIASPSPSVMPASTAPVVEPLFGAWEMKAVGPLRPDCWARPRLVAALGGLVLQEDGCDGNEEPRPWLTRDGTSWERLAGVPGSVIRGDGAGGGLSLRCDRLRPDYGTCLDGSIWHTADGDRWTKARVVDQPPASFFTDIAESGGILVATGSQNLECDGTPYGGLLPGSIMLADCTGEVPTEPILYRSTDGRRWTRVRPIAVTAGQSAPSFFGGQILAADGGTFVVEGSIGSEAALWTSADGITWTAAPLPGSSNEWGSPSVARGRAGWVAVGPAAQGEPAAWASTDGLEWTIHPAPEVPGEDMEGSVRGVQRLDDGYLAYGTSCVACTLGSDCAGDDPPDLPCSGTFWRSADGAAWTPVGPQPPCENAEPGLVGVVADRVVVIGLDSDDESPGPAVACSARVGS